MVLFSPDQIGATRRKGVEVLNSRNLVITDANKHLYSNQSSVLTLTLNGGIFTADDEIHFSKLGSGSLVLTPSGVTINGESFSVSLPQNGFCILRFFSPTDARVWVIQPPVLAPSFPTTEPSVTTFSLSRDLILGNTRSPLTDRPYRDLNQPANPNANV